MTTRIERILSGLLTFAALVIALVVVRREFFAARPPVSRATLQLEYDSQWQGMLEQGIRMGAASAPLQLIEFVDFECPVCRGFHRNTWPAIQKKFRDQLALTVIHSPLSIHRFARIAARAIECATSVGQGSQMMEVVFTKQDSLGLKSWPGYAAEAGVSDTVQFTRCVTASNRLARIDSGLALFQRKGIRGTPTFFLNGWRFSIPPSDEEFARVADALLAGRKPAL